METRPRCQQRTEKSVRRSTWASAVTIERRNGSLVLSVRAYIQGRHKVWSNGKTDEKAARRKATEDFFKLHRRIAQGGHLHGHLLSEAVEKFLDYADTRLTRELSSRRVRNILEKSPARKSALETYADADG